MLLNNSSLAMLQLRGRSRFNSRPTPGSCLRVTLGLLFIVSASGQHYHHGEAANIPRPAGESKRFDVEGVYADNLSLAFAEAKESSKLSSHHLRGQYRDAHVIGVSGKGTEELQLSPAQKLSNAAILSDENWEIIRNSVLLSRTADSLQPNSFNMAVDANHKLINLASPAPEGTYDSGTDTDYPQGGDGFDNDWEAWYDGDDDVTVVASKGGLCYAAFRSTTFSLTDWLDNFDTNTVRMNDNAQCEVPRGFFRGWKNNYSDSLEQKLTACANEKCASTNGKDCIVFAGFSQGGSIASVATVAFSHMKPKMTVNFGTLRTLQKGCKEYVNPNRFIRFCNTRRAMAFGILYDVACSREMPGWTSLEDFGHYFILPPDDNSDGMQYYGRDDGVHGFKAMTLEQNPSPHHLTGPESYPSKLLYLAEDTTTATATGFVEDQACNSDHNCESERCAGHICKAKMKNNSMCQKDWHCHSGRCASTVPWTCKDLRGEGGGCGNTGDCKAGLKCTGNWWWKKCTK